MAEEVGDAGLLLFHRMEHQLDQRFRLRRHGLREPNEKIGQKLKMEWGKQTNQ